MSVEVVVRTIVFFSDPRAGHPSDATSAGASRNGAEAVINPVLKGRKAMGRLGRHKGALVASLAAVSALAMTASSTLGGFSAGISNSASTFSSATVQLEEYNGTTTCYSTGSGSGGSVTATNYEYHMHDQRSRRDTRPGSRRVRRSRATLTFTNVGNHAVNGRIARDGHLYASDRLRRQRCTSVRTPHFATRSTSRSPTPPPGPPTSAFTRPRRRVCPALANTYNLSTLAAQTFNRRPVCSLLIAPRLRRPTW